MNTIIIIYYFSNITGLHSEYYEKFIIFLTLDYSKIPKFGKHFILSIHLLFLQLYVNGSF